MDIHINLTTLLIGYLVLSGVIVVVRGLTFSTREYTPWDAILAPIEIGLLIWLVTAVAA